MFEGGIFTYNVCLDDSDVQYNVPQSDVIALPDFHYLIAQMYCSTADAAVQHSLTPGDDAMSARWYSLHEMDELCGQGLTTGSVVAVVRRAMVLRERGVL